MQLSADQQEFIAKSITPNEADKRAAELLKQVPKLNQGWAYVCAIINVFFPGIGTIIGACVSDRNINKTQFFVGLTQLLTSIYIVGWIWSIYWSYLMILRSKGGLEQAKKDAAALGAQANQATSNAAFARNAYGDSADPKFNPY